MSKTALDTTFHWYYW